MLAVNSLHLPYNKAWFGIALDFTLGVSPSLTSVSITIARESG